MFRGVSRRLTNMSTRNTFYTVQPLTPTFGGVVDDGFSIEDAASADDELIERIRSDVHKYRFLLFRKQKDLSGERQVTIELCSLALSALFRMLSVVFVF